MYLVGICGKARAGKDTVADLLCDTSSRGLIVAPGNNHIKSPMAGPLKAGIQAIFGKLPSDEEKEDPVPGFEFTWRRAMQTLGTEWGRELDVDIWTKIQQHNLEAAKGFADMFVVPDIRFDNEAEWLFANDGILVEVRREGVPLVAPHQSEAGLGYTPSIIIYNNGTLEDLRESVKEKIWARLR